MAVSPPPMTAMGLLRKRGKRPVAGGAGGNASVPKFGFGVVVKALRGGPGGDDHRFGAVFLFVGLNDERTF
jgi:hypothetical protein